MEFLFVEIKLPSLLLIGFVLALAMLLLSLSLFSSSSSILSFFCSSLFPSRRPLLLPLPLLVSLFRWFNLIIVSGELSLFSLSLPSVFALLLLLDFRFLPDLNSPSLPFFSTTSFCSSLLIVVVVVAILEFTGFSSLALSSISVLVCLLVVVGRFVLSIVARRGDEGLAFQAVLFVVEVESVSEGCSFPRSSFRCSGGLSLSLFLPFSFTVPPFEDLLRRLFAKKSGADVEGPTGVASNVCLRWPAG